MSEQLPSNTAQDIVTDYLHNLDAIRESMEPLMTISWAMHRKADSEHLESLEQLGELIEDDGNLKKFEIPIENYRKIQKKRTRSSRASRAFDSLPRLLLISFVSEYDAFLGRLVSHLHATAPELLNSSEKTFSISDILTFDSFSEVKEKVLEAEVEGLLRKSHADQFSWLESRFSVELRKGLERWPIFIEVTERRNLFVHTDGVVSNQYTKTCKKHGFTLGDVKPGHQLKASKAYLIEAYKCLYEFGVKLAQVLWQKVLRQDIGKADQSLVEITYDLLVEEKIDLATRLLEFSVDVLPRHSTDVYRRMFIINLSQAYLFSDNEDKCLARLDKEDWSACGLDFKTCVAVLKRNFSYAIRLMHEIGTSGPISKQQYLEWPIFREFRQDDRFEEAYETIFGERPVLEEEHAKDERHRPEDAFND
jgi:hypothetical protein